MAKRFTENTKWDDRWFVELKSEFKLAWFYLCDCCDVAGVIDFSERLANFRIGIDIDWKEFFESAEGRVEQLDNGKLWITGFCDFQYGKLSESCNAHIAVFRSLERNGLSDRVNEGLVNPRPRVSEGYLKGTPRVQDKDKDKDKDKDLDKDQELVLFEKEEFDDGIPRTVEQVFEFIKTLDIKTPEKLTVERKAKIRARLKDPEWAKYLVRARDKLPLEGNDWQPGVAWLVKNSTNVVELVEGKFDWLRQKNSTPAQRTAENASELLEHLK